MAYELTAFIGVGSPPPGAFPLPQGAWLLPLLAGNVPPPASPVVFVTAEFWGGQGAQAATLYIDGLPPQPFETGYNAINQALRALGITAECTAESNKDEFDSLGLGRYRRTEDWLRAIAPPPAL